MNNSNIQTAYDQHPFVDQTIQFLVGVINLYNFQNDALYVSFNGGKDATTVLYLTLFAMQRMNDTSQIKCIYFEEKEPFDQVDEFISEQIKKLNLKMITIKENAQKGLENLKNTTNMHAVIMGTRSTDPHGEQLEKISVTDSGYPAMFRINPILYWTYEQVWTFLKEFNIPYCPLYDQGYTYLGNQTNTVPNHFLRIDDHSFKQAWEANGEIELFSRKHHSKSEEPQKSEKPRLLLFSGPLSKVTKDRLSHLQDQTLFFNNDREIKKFLIGMNLSQYREVVIRNHITDKDLNEILSKQTIQLDL